MKSGIFVSDKEAAIILSALEVMHSDMGDECTDLDGDNTLTDSLVKPSEVKSLMDVFTKIVKK